MTLGPDGSERAKAVIFAVMPPGAEESREERDRMAEIGELIGSAEMDVVGQVVQHKHKPDPRAYLGPGKLQDLRAAVTESAATCAVCEDDLSPAQVAAVLDALDVDVLDRTELILSVFSRHARSLEGRLQVDLAQLQYELTRVRGQGHVMSRLGAGTDMRGPGEQKLEVDRRVIRQRIQALRGRIERMARTRRTQRARRVRADLPLIALAGYTNAGKSTLLNALTAADVSVADRLFETLDPTTRSFRYRDRDYLVTDTVGFIRKLPHLLVDAFASTLEETRMADLLLVVADASQPPDEIAAHQETVADVLAEIGSSDVPRLLVMNKVDLIDAPARARLEGREPDAVFLSARTGTGLDDLREAVSGFFERSLVAVRLLVPYDKGAVIDRLHGVATDIRQESTPEGTLIEARLPQREASRYASLRIDVASDGGTLDDDDSDESDLRDEGDRPARGGRPDEPAHGGSDESGHASAG
jgi:GTP-binding protein HflX